MELSPDDLEDTVGLARDYLHGSRSDPQVLSRDFAEAIVQLAASCVVGVPCVKHGSAIHGQEAEELRAGVEQILKNTSDVEDEAASDVLRSIRKSLIFLLDRIDARDSLAFREGVGTCLDYEISATASTVLVDAEDQQPGANDDGTNTSGND